MIFTCLSNQHAIQEVMPTQSKHVSQDPIIKIF